MSAIFDQDLPKNEANYAAMTPLALLERSARVYPDKPAIVYGLGPSALRYTWSALYDRCCMLASALEQSGIGKGDTVAVLLPNTPVMVQAHFGIPMTGAVINALNTRLNAETIALMLDHGEAKAIIVDTEFAPIAQQALELRKTKETILVINVADSQYTGSNAPIGDIEYERFIARGSPHYAWQPPADEWDAIALNYTSGTTGNPKGVVYHHRGAMLAAVSNILEWDMPKHPVYLWTLPMFHCNGWTFPWAIAARAGVNVCLRKVEAQAIIDNIRDHNVTHYCGAPIVHNLLINAPDEMKAGLPIGVKAMVAGASPPISMIEGMEQLGFDLLHVYGLTEVYGPASVCVRQAAWDAMDLAEQARLNGRQGVVYHLQRDIAVMHPKTMEPVPADGKTMGEIMFRGNIVMKGYLKNPDATTDALREGWFHSGDLAVVDPDGYIKIKDRSKDIIISGGENISSIEIEDVLYRHRDIIAAAVVARPDERWGETPCAFVELKAGAFATAEEIINHCKQHLPAYQAPRMVIFKQLPKTSTGKIQKHELRKMAEALK